MSFDRHTVGTVRFAGYELREDRRELRFDGRVLELRRRPFDLLLRLLHHRDRVVPREELLEHVWAGVCVSDAALSSAMRDLRKALSAGGPASSVIRTHHGFGYRFVAAVELDAAESPALNFPSAPAGEGAPSRDWLERFFHRLSLFVLQEFAGERAGLRPGLADDLAAWAERESAAAVGAAANRYS